MGVEAFRAISLLPTKIATLEHLWSKVLGARPDAEKEATVKSKKKDLRKAIKGRKVLFIHCGSYGAWERGNVGCTSVYVAGC